jgi:hypothetical protein
VARIILMMIGRMWRRMRRSCQYMRPLLLLAGELAHVYRMFLELSLRIGLLSRAFSLHGPKNGTLISTTKRLYSRIDGVTEQ